MTPAEQYFQKSGCPGIFFLFSSTIFRDSLTLSEDFEDDYSIPFYFVRVTLLREQQSRDELTISKPFPYSRKIEMSVSMSSNSHRAKKNTLVPCEIQKESRLLALSGPSSLALTEMPTNFFYFLSLYFTNSVLGRKKKKCRQGQTLHIFGANLCPVFLMFLLSFFWAGQESCPHRAVMYHNPDYYFLGGQILLIQLSTSPHQHCLFPFLLSAKKNNFLKQKMSCLLILH